MPIKVQKNSARLRRLPIVRTVSTQTLEDTDVAWTLQAYRCRTQLRWCLRELRTVYPHARVTIITDGDPQRYDDIAATFGCTLVRGKRWMTLDTCHLYIERLLRSMIAGPETYTFKIDPDTRVWRRFQRLPGFCSIFGTLETVTEHLREDVRGAANVQGGCIGATRSAIATILDSGIVNHQSCAVDFARTWARCGDMTSAAARAPFAMTLSFHGPLTRSAFRSSSAPKFARAGAGPSRTTIGCTP